MFTNLTFWTITFPLFSVRNLLLELTMSSINPSIDELDALISPALNPVNHLTNRQMDVANAHFQNFVATSKRVQGENEDLKAEILQLKQDNRLLQNQVEAADIDDQSDQWLIFCLIRKILTLRGQAHSNWNFADYLQQFYNENRKDLVLNNRAPMAVRNSLGWLFSYYGTTWEQYEQRHQAHAHQVVAAAANNQAPIP